MSASTKGKWLIGIGISFYVLSLISMTIPLIGTGIGIISGTISWAFLIVGIVLWITSKRRISALVILKRLGFRRQDIIKSTNWERLGTTELVKSIGASLATIGTILLIVELAIGNPYPLFPIWIITVIIGIILSLWKPYSINRDHTRRILVKIPDLLSIHTFHTSLRQRLEDAGYAIAESVSPGENSSVSSFGNNIFLLNGGIRGMKKSTSPSKLLIPELSDTSIISSAFTLFGIGILLIFLGLTLIVHGITTWKSETWSSVVGTIAIVFLFIGIAVLIYDYISRTRRLAQIYIIEEGTVYIPTLNIYDPRTLEETGYNAEPSVSVMHTSCELIVTVGATRNGFFDISELENDFDAIVQSIENIKVDNTLNAKDVTLFDVRSK